MKSVAGVAVLFAAAALAACGGRTSDPPSAGTFHLGTADEINLVLDEAGTFRWRVFGCDYEGGASGAWRREGDALVLVPASGSKLEWPTEGSYRSEVDRLTLTRAERTADSEIAVTGVARRTGKSFAQTWKRGRVCASCSAGGHVSLRACEGPLPAFSASQR
jgi:hypothetical protein